MISTFTSYQMYSADLPKALNRTATESQVAREAQYYRDNISKVKSADDLLGDSRLYGFAMKAYGLADMIESKAFMRKVLQSDLTDDKSFANQLVDPRYLKFASSFNFSKGGAIAATTVTAQEAKQSTNTQNLYSEHRTRQGLAFQTEVAYFRDHIGSVTTVDDLVGNSRMLSLALRANGIDPTYASTTAIRDVLTSDLSDPNSVANTFGPRYQALAASFSFQPDGTTVPGTGAQTSSQTDQFLIRAFDATGNGDSPAAATFRTQVYNSAMAAVTNVDDFLARDELVDYALVAFGLSTAISKDSVRALLTSDLSDPDSYANKQALAYQAFAGAFNFNTDGSLDAGEPAQTASAATHTTDLHFERYDDSAVSSEAMDTTFYKLLIARVPSAADFVKSSALYNYALTAFDLDPAKESKVFITKILQSDPADPRSFANTQTDPRYRALAKAYNFSSDGKPGAPHSAQLDTYKAQTIELYTRQFTAPPITKDKAIADSKAYSSFIDTVTNVDEFIKNKTMVKYTLQAYGLAGETITDQTLRKILTSDPTDPASFINSSANQRYKTFAMAFNFGTDGTASRLPATQAQDRSGIAKTLDLYVRESLETTAGEQNVGVRLALYFQRNAPKISSWYEVLGDKALYEVLRTALNFPDDMAKLDFEKQIAMITQKVDVNDFKDPAKLDKFLNRFTTMYDMKQDSATTSPILALFQ